jgi:exodeoxyribonuclease VII large subunit
LEQFSLQLIPEQQVYSVKELNAAVRSALESEFRDIRVLGEISGTRLATSGHCYFTLKEQDSLVKCVCYRSAYRYLKVKPQDGLAVTIRGQLGVFEARGEYQIQVEALEPIGQGALQLAFEDLKKRLAAEGLFDSKRKRNMPRFPQKIGIVTSPKGAVISDMLHVFERRFPGLHIRLFPAAVQGEGSIEEVCRGIGYFSESGWADVVIVARGGGSLEDLWTFNTEAVARAIAMCEVPLISAVGHETDVTISDFVADMRAPTPSAAAEILSLTHADILEKVRNWEKQLTRGMRHLLERAQFALQKRAVEGLASTLIRGIGRQLQRVDDYEYRLKENIRATIDLKRSLRRGLEDRLRRRDQRLQLERGKNRVEAARSALCRMIETRILQRRKSVEMPAAVLKQLSPVKVLERGYAVVFDIEGRLIKDASTVSVGTEIQVRLASGRLAASVTGRQSQSE